MIGAVPDDEKSRIHGVGLGKGIAELNSIVKPTLAVVDALNVITMRGPIGVL